MKRFALLLIGAFLFIAPEALISSQADARPLTGYEVSQVRTNRRVIRRVRRRVVRTPRCTYVRRYIPGRYIRGRYIPGRYVVQRVCRY